MAHRWLALALVVVADCAGGDGTRGAHLGVPPVADLAPASPTTATSPPPRTAATM